MYKVYVKTDGPGRIVSVNSDAFLFDTDGWTLIDEGDGDKFHHAQGNYFQQPIITDEGIYRYKLVDGEVQERTADEIQADIDAIPPPPPDPLVATQKAAAVMFRALAQTDVITAEDALDNQDMFEGWADYIDKAVPAGIYLRHEDGLYRVQQAHTVQEHQPPSVHTAALYTRVQPEGAGPEVWQPGQSYAKGVEVAHSGGVWVSGVDNNVWEPGAVNDNIWRRVRDV